MHGSSALSPPGGANRNGAPVVKAWTTPPPPLKKPKDQRGGASSNGSGSSGAGAAPAAARPSVAAVAAPRVAVGTAASLPTAGMVVSPLIPSPLSRSRSSSVESSGGSPSAPAAQPRRWTSGVTTTPRASAAPATPSTAIASPKSPHAVAMQKTAVTMTAAKAPTTAAKAAGGAKAAPAPILKRHNSKYSRPPPPAPVWFRVMRHKHPPPDAPIAGTSAIHIQCEPRLSVLYQSVADQLDAAPEVIQLFCFSREIAGGGVAAAVELVTDRDLERCLAEWGPPPPPPPLGAASGGTATSSNAIPLAAVVADGGALGRLCISLGAAALRGCHQAEALWRHWSGQWLAPGRRGQSLLLALGTAVAASVALYALNGVLERVRTRAPRVTYRPTRQLVALGRRSPTSVFLPPPKLLPPPPSTPASSSGR